MLLDVEYKRNRSQSNYHGIDEDRSKVKVESIFKSFVGLESTELIDSATSDCCRRTGIGSGAVAGANDIAIFEIESAHLALMDRSAVVSARSGRGKSLDLSLLSLPVVSDDAHRVSSLDLLDILPTNLMAGKRINNHQSFVVEDDSWMKEDLIGESASKERPGASDNSTCESVVKEVHVSKRAEEKETQEGKNVRARGSEELAIVHKGIFSRAREMRAA